MNKTIFNLDYKISIVIVSVLGVIFGFLSNAYYVGGLLGFVLYILRFALFVGVFMIFYFIEKNNQEFKAANKRMLGYLTLSSLFNIVFAIFTTTHLLKELFLVFSGIVCFYLIVAFVIEILRLYFNNKLVDKIFIINEKIGLTIANPIINLFSKTTND